MSASIPTGSREGSPVTVPSQISGEKASSGGGKVSSSSKVETGKVTAPSQNTDVASSSIAANKAAAEETNVVSTEGAAQD